MDERKITDTIANLFASCENVEKVNELESMLNDIVKQEYENRLYDLSH